MKTITFESIQTRQPLKENTTFSISYRRFDQANWTSFVNVVVNTLGVIITNPSPSITLPYGTYVFRYRNEFCGAFALQNIVIEGDDEPVITWIIESYFCESDSPLILEKNIEGFADPYNVGYDEPTGRVYCVDYSSVSGSNIFWFNPQTINSPSDVTPVGSLSYHAGASVMDMAERKIYITGGNTNGCFVYDIATNTTNFLEFGVTALYTKLVLFSYQNNAMLFCMDWEDRKIFFINKSSFTISSSIALSSIPNYQRYFNAATLFFFINNQWWVIQNQASAGTTSLLSSSIGVYNSDFSIQEFEVPLPTHVLFSNLSYWRSAYLDGDILLIMDYGSSRLTSVNVVTRAVNEIHYFNNRLGKLNMAASVVRDDITGELFVSGDYRNSATDTSPISVTYKLNANYTIGSIYPSLTYGTRLTRLGATEFLVGAYNGVNTYPTPGGGSGTDGVINIFSKQGVYNNGWKNALTIRQVVDGVPTSTIKDNILGESDYIERSIDLVNCALSYTTECPLASRTIKGGDSVDYEFSIPSSTYNNPSISSIEIEHYGVDSEDIFSTTVISKTGYHSGSFSKNTGELNAVRLLYKDSSNDILEICDLFTF